MEITGLRTDHNGKIVILYSLSWVKTGYNSVFLGVFDKYLYTVYMCGLSIMHCRHSTILDASLKHDTNKYFT